MKEGCNIKRALLLDMDGLMFDTERLAIRSWVEAGRAYGLIIPEDVVLSNLGRGAHETLKRLESCYPGAPVEDMLAFRIKYSFDAIERDGPTPMPGLYELLDRAEALGYVMAVATSTSYDRARRVLERADVFHRLSALSCGGEGVPSKPEPDIFLNAARMLDVPPEHCVVLEDSPFGIEAGLRAGMRVIAVPDLLPVPEELVPRVRVVKGLIEAAGML